MQRELSRRASSYPVVSRRLSFARDNHKVAAGRGLSFHNREWLRAIYEDPADYLVIAKSSQVGLTEFAIADMFYLASTGISGLYVLPTDILRSTFVPNRIDAAINNSAVYAAHTSTIVDNSPSRKKGSDSRVMKSIFGNNWKFIGANVQLNFYEFPAGAIIIDEFDLCNQENLVFAADRMGAAKKEIWRKFGNPTLAGYGIDEEYERSDKRVWKVRCSHCNEQQELQWFVNVVEQTADKQFHLKSTALAEGGDFHASHNNGGIATTLCRRCNKPIDRLSAGEWVAEHPGRPVHGYKVSRLFGDPRRDLPVLENMFTTFLQAHSHSTHLQRFYNNVLGEVYDAAGTKISESVMAECATEYTMPATGVDCIAGVDVGNVFHLHIEEIKTLDDGRMVRRKMFIGTVPDYESIDFLCKLYGVRKGVMDAGGEIHAPRQFAKSHPGWYLCNYNKREQDKHTHLVDHANKTVRVNRTESLDASLSEYLEKRVQLPINWRSLDDGDFVKQMAAPTRILDEKRNPPAYIWDEGSRPDHHRHADNYALIAAAMCGYGQRLFLGGWV